MSIASACFPDVGLCRTERPLGFVNHILLYRVYLVSGAVRSDAATAVAAFSG